MELEFKESSSIVLGIVEVCNQSWRKEFTLLLKVPRFKWQELLVPGTLPISETSHTRWRFARDTGNLHQITIAEVK